MITIVITGPSGSGKSYLSDKLSRLFKNTIVIKTDSYYRDNFFIRILSIFKFDIYDRPLSIKKYEIMKNIDSIYKKDKSVYLSKYNFKKRQSSKTPIKINYNGRDQFLILEGVFSHCLDIDYKNSINIVCKEEKNICYKRRLIRDRLDRGRKTKEINKKFNMSWYLFYKNLNNFISRYKVITLNPSNDFSYEKLVSMLQQKKLR